MIKGAKNKNELIQKIAPLLLALAIVFTYTRVFIIPTFKKWRNLTPKVAQLKADVKSAQASIETIDTLKNRLNNLKQQIGAYENRLPQQKEIPVILEHLSSLALESGVKITAIEPSKASSSSTPKDYSEVPITLIAKCGYHQLGTFISKLENSSQFMKISNIKISRNPSDVYHHNIDLRISTFTLTEENNSTSDKK